MSDRGEEVSAGERLLNQNCSAMRRRKLLPPIAADKGEGDAARLKRIGDASDRLTNRKYVPQKDFRAPELCLAKTLDLKAFPFHPGLPSSTLLNCSNSTYP